MCVESDWVLPHWMPSFDPRPVDMVEQPRVVTSSASEANSNNRS